MCPPKYFEDIESVGSLGRGGQAEKHAGPDVVEQSLVARRGGVVKLVDDNVLIAIGGQFVERPALIALDRHEQVIELARLAAADQKVAEVGVAKNIAKRLETLSEATPRGGRRREAEAFVLSPKIAHEPSGDNRTRRSSSCRFRWRPRPGGGRDLEPAFGIEPVEDLLLERPGPELDTGTARGRTIPTDRSSSSACFSRGRSAW